MRPPRFALSCAVDVADAEAWIEVAAFAPGRLLGDRVVDVLAWPKGTPQGTYTRFRYETTAAAGQADPAADFVRRLNEVRSQAGLKAVRLAAAQSRQNQKLAPHYFAAALEDGQEKTMDTIAAGLFAGWQVEGMVNRAHFGAHVISGADPGELLSAFLARPFGRQVLLDAQVEQVAVGPLQADGLTAAVVTSYALFVDRPQQEVVREVIAHLNAARAKKGVGPVHWVASPVDADARAAGALLRNEATPMEALDGFLQECAAATNRSFRGWVYQVGSLEEIEWPEEMLTRQPLAVIGAVGRYRDPGEPWGYHVLMFGLTDAGPVMTAQLGP